jgi:hypothetical protein
MPELLILAFLQVKLKKNAKTNSSGILIRKIFKKKCQNYSFSIFTSKIEKNARTISSSILYIKMHRCYANQNS